ncbi:adhesion G protein-coupled receptor L4 isoform X2 [Sarcophilus harrisii]|uniref:Adhesion G protein-coupled receptor L4 n=1 Tax=Sarcophilus harrisii TaxID=9305 RepID=G3WQ06_SARHA|nr:adhesion G protein-coupled receptor L4 isoform X2 [Sarcophilus harrisii]
MKLIPLLVCLSTLLDGAFAQNCARTHCNPKAKCEIQNGVEGCYCFPGFTGNGITICEDDNECENSTQPCGENANCTNTEGSYFCMCAPGFTSSSSQIKFVTNDGTTCIENMKANCHLDDVCIAANINKTLIEIKHTKEPLNLLQEIYQNSEQALFPIDILTNVEALSTFSPSLCFMSSNVSEKEAFTNTTINVFVNTVNNLVQKDKITIWDKLSADNRRTSLTKLMHTAEQTMLNMSQNFKKTTQLEINSSDMGLKLLAFDSHHMKHIHPHVNMEGNYIKIYPKKKDENYSNGTVVVVFLHYKSIGAMLSSSLSASQETESNNNPEQEEIVISSIVSVSVSAKPSAFYQLEKIMFTLSHVKPREKDSSECAFWNYSSNTMNGSWSTEGCELMHSNSTHTSCKCNHLTHFAILMSSGASIGIKDYNILTRITQLGIIISLVCLAMCIFTFWFFSEIQSTRTTIHKNLCCSLFLAELVFLVGINTNSNKLFCSIIAGLLHYFFLAAFAWMCIEGIHLYLIVVGVIYNKGFLHKNFYIFGYLSPAVVVGFSAALGYRYYGTTKVCWLSTENNFIWSFIGPACLIILVNLLAFGVIIYKVFRHTAMLKPEVSCYENIRSCARGALALLFLLGTTWIFGVLHVVHASVVTAYLFTICNAFQGMFIFIFLCVLSRKIQEEYYRLFKNVPCCSGCLR